MDQRVDDEKASTFAIVNLRRRDETYWTWSIRSLFANSFESSTREELCESQLFIRLEIEDSDYLIEAVDNPVSVLLSPSTSISV